MESNSSVEELLEKAREQGKIYLEEPFHQKDFHHYFNCQTWEEWVSVLIYCEGRISSTPARDWLLHSRSPEVVVVCLSELPRVQPRSQFQREDAAFATTKQQYHNIALVRRWRNACQKVSLYSRNILIGHVNLDTVL